MIGFQLGQSPKFSGFGLASSCEQVLYQTIACDSYVLNLGQRVYHGALGDTGLTDAVCAATCATALTAARRRIAGACASTPDLFTGYPVLSLIDSIQAGWNETCLKDTETGKYCNAIEDMPEEQVCSYCYGAKLSLMQSSPYSVYDELHAQQLEYINEHCGKPELPTEQLPPPIAVNGTAPSTCASERIYTTKEGDTCDSIALANHVSGAALYYTNPSISNCSVPVVVGSELCLPLQCETTYTVQEGDRCIPVAIDNGVAWQKLVDWNPMLNDRCTNLVSNSSANNYWGRVICVSAPGGLAEGVGNSTTPGNGDTGGQGGSGDGYSDSIAAVPNGTIAEGTTRKCGEWVQITDGITCSVMLARSATPIPLFLAANPSLKSAAECTANLVQGAYYYRIVSNNARLPLSNFYLFTLLNRTIFQVNHGWIEPPPTKADPNTIQDCTWWHVASSSDTCSGVASMYGLTVDQLVAYNPVLSVSCAFVDGNSYCIEQNWGTPPISFSYTISGVYLSSCVKVCVGIIGGSTVSPTITATPTTTKSPGNGITTPTPIQSGMVTNCNKFDFVKSGDGCPSIADRNGISLADFYKWNPAVGGDCRSLWLDTYVCVGTTGSTPVPTTTKKTTTTSKTTGNGISTPTPIQTGMATNCDAFYFVKNGDDCQSIADKAKITLTDFYKWNPAVGNNCRSLWLDTYVCISLI
ncbi:hypothetical protein GGR51DRAFT_547171 [Nemania sp. FL0031]|nr:hypothetical protein GGR51DRAFT_547171 [Nemania sp. FL0031]